MNLKRPHHGKSKAQAMVEFAIALPFLLLLLYGILETGRYVFLYSTVVTASRQAVRYGSATGVGVTTDPSTGLPVEHRYWDCDSIRAAAKHAAVLGPFSDNNIVIKYDTGPNTTATTYCGAGTAIDKSFIPRTDNTSRISVQVVKTFTPLVKLVPFTPSDITAESARTILVSVSIEVTSPPMTFLPPPTDTFTPSPTPSPTNTPTNTPTPTATNTPKFTYTPSNTPTRTLTPVPSSTPTLTVTPTIAASPVPSCDAVTNGPISKANNTLYMTITNPYGFPLTFKDATLTWNNDKGHQTGSDKTLSLQGASLDGTVFWTGNISGPTYTIVANPVVPPNSTVTLTFTFDKSYDTFDGTESIWINLLTPGCENNSIQS